MRRKEAPLAWFSGHKKGGGSNPPQIGVAVREKQLVACVGEE